MTTPTIDGGTKGKKRDLSEVGRQGSSADRGDSGTIARLNYGHKLCVGATVNSISGHTALSNKSEGLFIVR
jgi:hypothetical protein